MTDPLSRLPKVRGTYQPAAELAKHTWFGVGGPADILFCPLDENDLGEGSELQTRVSRGL